MIRIVKANKVDNINREMSVLFVDSFYDYFKSFCSSKEKLYRVCKNIFNLDKFYVALLNNELIGIGACSDGSSSIKFNKIKLFFNFGLSLGKRLYKYLKTIFIDRDYSFDIDKECGMIEFVVVKENYRRSKVGYTLVNHMMHDNNFKRYLAKVGDNNYSATKMLEKIGFEIFDEETSTSIEKDRIGINKYLYMISENCKFNKS